MKLFFETGEQTTCFLAMVLIGFIVALLADCGTFGYTIRAIMDVLFMFAAGVLLLSFLIFFQEPNLRLYHLLGWLVGHILYKQGAGKIFRLLICRQEKQQTI